ncbi:protein of unknown function [Candidatus Filomicrobium marinum]|uniref:Uncharacterized protein n=1 Tax=Candidatus Filomicrobium marinum TaxID=1608628 RepID=A0A0D6JD89_9HYPH|nr:protein of unknown function [Candidatus Filomicrobium marinum]CPR17683.1 protein of unknown function [Candidatus Filomicrobium marinum]
MADGNTNLADFAAGEFVVAVVASLCRQVERDREAGLPLRKIFTIQLVRLRGRRMAGIRSENPRPVARNLARRSVTGLLACGVLKLLAHPIDSSKLIAFSIARYTIIALCCNAEDVISHIEHCGLMVFNMPDFSD